jgi:uncharacterized protein YcnI
LNVSRAAALGALIALALVAPANAHVTLAPSVLAAGAIDELTFRCPNERPSAATTQLIVQLPEEYPLRLVKVRPVPGWHATVTMRKLAKPIHGRRGDISSTVDTVTWSGGTIKPGEYQDFALLAGPMPRGVHQLAFKAVQTYANGEVVRWIQLRGPGEPAPPNPAPILQLR